MSELMTDPRFRRRWALLSEIAEKRLHSLSDVERQDADARVGGYMTTHGMLHARLFAGALAIKRARIGDPRLAEEFTTLLDESHGDRISDMRREFEQKIRNPHNTRKTALGEGFSISLHSGNKIVLQCERHRIEVILSSEIEDVVIGGSEPVRVERRHIMVAEQMVRSALHQRGDPQSATRCMVVGRHPPSDEEIWGYDRHEDTEAFPPYSVPVTLTPSKPWSHGMQGRLGIVAPQRLIHDQNGAVGEGVELRTVSLSAFDLVHDVPHSLTHTVRNAAEIVCESLTTRQRARIEALVIEDEILEAMKQSDGTTRIARYAMLHDRKRVQIDLTLIGYCPSTYREKEYRVYPYESDVPSMIKKMRTQIDEQITNDIRLHAKVGFPPIPNDEKPVDLSLYTIDRPLLALFRSAADANVADMVREAIRTGGKMDSGNAWMADVGKAARLGMSMDRGRLKANFHIADKVEWRGGRLKFEDVILPAAARNGLAGMPVGALVRHPYLSDEMIIQSFQEIVSGNRTDTYVYVGKSMTPATDAEGDRTA